MVSYIPPKTRIYMYVFQSEKFCNCYIVWYFLRKLNIIGFEYSFLVHEWLMRSHWFSSRIIPFTNFILSNIGENNLPDLFTYTGQSAIDSAFSYCTRVQITIYTNENTGNSNLSHNYVTLRYAHLLCMHFHEWYVILLSHKLILFMCSAVKLLGKYSHRQRQETLQIIWKQMERNEMTCTSLLNVV